MTRTQWRKRAKKCKWRVYDDLIMDGSGLRRGRYGNAICAHYVIGRRCVYGLAGCVIKKEIGS